MPRPSSKRMRSEQRVNSYNATLRRAASVDEFEFASPSWEQAAPFSLSDVEDNRQWSPEPRARTVTGNRVWATVQLPKYIIHKRPLIAREYYTNLPVGLQLPVGIKHRGMFPIVTCLRRKIRRMVMFATGRRHKGSGAKRKKSSTSYVRC